MIWMANRVHNNAIRLSCGPIANMFGLSSLPVSVRGAGTNCDKAGKSSAAVPVAPGHSLQRESSILPRAHRTGTRFAPKEGPEPIQEKPTGSLSAKGAH